MKDYKEWFVGNDMEKDDNDLFRNIILEISYTAL
jgi:hypothetical protein